MPSWMPEPRNGSEFMDCYLRVGWSDMWASVIQVKAYRTAYTRIRGSQVCRQTASISRLCRHLEHKHMCKLIMGAYYETQVPIFRSS